MTITNPARLEFISRYVLLHIRNEANGAADMLDEEKSERIVYNAMRMWYAMRNATESFAGMTNLARNE